MSGFTCAEMQGARLTFSWYSNGVGAAEVLA